jgi:hypothetical protein
MIMQLARGRGCLRIDLVRNPEGKAIKYGHPSITAPRRAISGSDASAASASGSASRLRINSSVSRARSSAEDFGMSAGDIGSVWQLRECARLAFELRMDQRQVPR